MEAILDNKTTIENTFSEVRELSFKEKKSPSLDEEQMNAFLDAILEFQNYLSEKTNKLNHINERIDKLTWLTNFTEEELMLLNDLISAARDLHSTLIRHYCTLDNFRLKGIAKEKIKEYKLAINDLKEAFTDIEATFFLLPEIPEFVETTKLLEIA